MFEAYEGQCTTWINSVVSYPGRGIDILSMYVGPRGNITWNFNAQCFINAWHSQSMGSKVMGIPRFPPCIVLCIEGNGDSTKITVNEHGKTNRKEGYWTCVIYSLTFSLTDKEHCAYFPGFNPILSGGGVNLTPPARNPWLPRDRRISRHAFSWLFFFQVLRIFWYQVCENRTVGREVTWRFVLARRHKICPKSAFCIGLCTKHMEITYFLKMH